MRTTLEVKFTFDTDQPTTRLTTSEGLLDLAEGALRGIGVTKVAILPGVRVKITHPKLKKGECERHLGSEGHLPWVIDMVRECCDLELTPEQANEVLEDPKVQAALAAGGRDTVTRETAADFLAQKVMGRGWPTYAEGGYDVFLAGFLHRASEMGYKQSP